MSGGCRCQHHMGPCALASNEQKRKSEGDFWAMCQPRLCAVVTVIGLLGGLLYGAGAETQTLVRSTLEQTILPEQTKQKTKTEVLPRKPTKLEMFRARS